MSICTHGGRTHAFNFTLSQRSYDAKVEKLQVEKLVADQIWVFQNSFVVTDVCIT